MHRMMLGLAMAMTLGAAAPALASEDEDARCGKIARDKWLPEAAIKTKVTDLGYQVRKIETEDGCYEVKGVDKNGAKVELYLNPETGEVVKPDTKEKDDS